MIIFIKVNAANYIAAITKEGYVCLIEPELQTKKVIYNWKTATIRKWNKPRIHNAIVKGNEITVVFYQSNQWGFHQNKDLSIVTELAYDITSDTLIFCRQFTHDYNLNTIINTIITSNDYLPFIKSLKMEDYQNIEIYHKSELINGFYYFSFFGLHQVPNLEADLNHFYNKPNDTKYETLLKEPPYKASSKLAYWGVEHFDIKHDKSTILVDFLLQEHMFYFSKRKPISHIYEIDLATKQQTILLKNGIRPSYSADGAKTLFEKVYYNRGFFNLRAKGYFIQDRQTGKETYLGKFTDAMFVKDFN